MNKSETLQIRETAIKVICYLLCLFVYVQIVASAVAVDALHTDTASNSAILQLRVGDRVYVRLTKSDRTLKDTQNLFSTFSGHLLYEI